MKIRVKKRNGRLESLNIDKINRFVERAAEGLSEVSASEVALTASISLYDGVTTNEITDALILSARQKIEKEPQYAYLAARLLLHKLYKEVFNENVDSDIFELQYKKSFVTNIKKLVKVGRLHPDLLKFDLKKLAERIVPERDLLFKYMGIQTLYDRYLIKSDNIIETPQAFWMRVAIGLSYNETDKNKSAIEIYDALSQFEYCHSTPTLFNSGTVTPQLSSCYLSTIDDSIDGIFGGIHEQARLSKHAGGLGVDFSPVRSSNAFIEGTAGHSNGVVPWLKIFNDTLIAVNQGGKRPGAGCAYLEVTHLDIEEFIDVKRNTGDDRRRCHDMNTAVWVPDAFMRAVESDGDWLLFNPNATEKRLHDYYGKEFDDLLASIDTTQMSDNDYRTVKAKDLWKKLLLSLKTTGHPWITFKDTINSRYSDIHAGIVHNSNLCTEITRHTIANTYENGEVKEYGETAVCLSEGTKILTKDGYLNIEDCDGKDIYVPFDSDDNFIRNDRFVKGKLIDNGLQPVIKITTKGGLSIEATQNHKFLIKVKYGDKSRGRLEKYKWKSVMDLTVGDKISQPLTENVFKSDNVLLDNEYLVAGWFVGDGWFSNEGWGVCFGPKEEYARNKVIGQIEEWMKDCDVIHSNNQQNVFPKVYRDRNGVYNWQSSRQSFKKKLSDKFGFERCVAEGKSVPDKILSAPPAQKASFVSGLFSADGCFMFDDRIAKKRGVVALTSASKELLVSVQLILKEFGIHGRITDSYPRVKYQGQLRISSLESIRLYHKYFGFHLCPDKQNKLDRFILETENYNNQYNGLNHSEILGLEYIGEKRVYDLSIEDGHHFIANGLTSHNCNLSSINLPTHIAYNDNDEPFINYDRLRRTVRTAIRALDNVIDINFYPIKPAKLSNDRYRPIGLGVMGLQDVLYILGIDYDSDDAVSFNHELMEKISYYAIEASVDLAEEKGAYPSFSGSLWSKGILPIDTYKPQLNTAVFPTVMNWDELRTRVSNGMRNGNVLAIAPTATISSIQGCRQSIEPDYSVLWVYSTLSGEFPIINEFFVEEAKKAGIWCQELTDAIKRCDGDLSRVVGEIPQHIKDKFRSVFRLNPMKLIECNAARQRFVDQAISFNLYSDSPSLKYLSDMYFHCWKMGLKTTYYLRSQGASKTEQSTVDTRTEPKVCAINDPTCESCQ